MRTLGFLLLAVLAADPARAVPPDILPPEKAFLVEARADGADIVLDWTVAPDHYLYKKRFSFAAETPGVELGPPSFPPGELHNDEFFGESTIFRGRFEVRVPASGYMPGTPVSLTIGAQGCNEAIGLCFPPQRWTREVILAAAPPVPAPAGGQASGASQDFLPPDEAFRLGAERLPDGSLKAVWDIAPDYYLYRHRLAFEVDGKSVTSESAIPDGKPKTDEFFGDVEVYYDRLEVTIPGPATGPVSLAVGYQGCAEGGLCYPPMRREATLDPGTMALLTGAPEPAGTQGAAFNPFLLASGGDAPGGARATRRRSPRKPRRPPLRPPARSPRPRRFRKSSAWPA